MASPPDLHDLDGTDRADRGVTPIGTPLRIKRELVLGFAAMGVVIVTLAAFGTRVNEMPTTAEFGLLQLLPWGYWFGLGLIGLSVGLSLHQQSAVLFALTGAIFFGVFAGTPVLFEPYPPVWDAYTHLAETQDIDRLGVLPSAPEEYSANWPGFFLNELYLSELGRLDAFSILGLIPFLTGAFTFLALFLFLRSIFPAPIASAGTMLGSLVNVWAQYHAAPQAMGLLLALLVLSVVWRKDIPARLASAVLFVGLVVIHPVSTILLLSVFVVDVVLTYGRRLIARAGHRRSTVDGLFAFSPALPFGVLWFGWLFFRAKGSTEVAERAIVSRISSIVAVPEQTINLATARTLENIYTWAPIFRLSGLLVIALIGLLGLGVLARHPKSRRLAQFLLAGLIGLVLVGLADILALRGAFFDRSLMFFAILTPAVCLAGVDALKRRKSTYRAVAIGLLVAAIVSASTAYYQEAFYFVSDEAVAVSEYFERTDPNATVLDGLLPIHVWGAAPNRTTQRYESFAVLYPIGFDSVRGRSTVYAVFDKSAEVWYRQWIGIDIYRFYETYRSNHSLIYSNGRAEIYLVYVGGTTT